MLRAPFSCARLAPRPDGPLTHFALPHREKCRQVHAAGGQQALDGFEAPLEPAFVRRSGIGRLLACVVRVFQPSHLELDEIWMYVRKRQKRVRRGETGAVGDAYCFIALDRATRLVVAWHLGKRDASSTNYFITKVRDATAGKFQISTDGFDAYPWAIATGLHDRATHGRIIKVTRPGRVETGFGDPDLDQTETTYDERVNATLRQWCKRYQRFTYASSKKWENLEHALALHFAYYNFSHVHQTLEVTPAMEAGLADEPWSIFELVERAV